MIGRYYRGKIVFTYDEVKQLYYSLELGSMGLEKLNEESRARMVTLADLLKEILDDYLERKENKK